MEEALRERDELKLRVHSYITAVAKDCKQPRKERRVHRKNDGAVTSSDDEA